MQDKAMVMDEDAAAHTLCISPRTLQRWRLEGRGPAYIKMGKRVGYAPEDLRAFIAKNTVRVGELSRRHVP